MMLFIFIKITLIFFNLILSKSSNLKFLEELEFFENNNTDILIARGQV